MYINWATVEGMGQIKTAWEGDYLPGDTVALGGNREYRLVEIYREDDPAVGPSTRHWMAIPKKSTSEVPTARRCVICADLAESQDLHCGCHEGCTDFNLLSFLCTSCLEADTEKVACVREHVQRANALW